MAGELLRYAEFKQISPPSISISPGRSLYAQSSQDSDWVKAEIPGIKAKGIAGIAPARNGQGLFEFPGGFVVIDNLKYVISPPMPKQAFIMSDRVHIGISEDLRLDARISQPKHWFSLSGEGAEREFDCQESLAKNSLGFGALCAGNFMQSKDQLEVDGLQRPTGGVFLVHNPEAKLVSRFSHFSVYKTKQGELKVFKPAETLKGREENTGNIDLSTLIEDYIYFAVRMAEVKAQGLYLAGVARHSSHEGNFWYVEHKDQIQMSNNDTCLLLKDQPEEMHGIILLRDYSTYVSRVLRQLALNVFDAGFFYHLDTETYRPVHRVLEELFKDMAKTEDINKTSTAIVRGYMDFVFGKDGKGGEYTEELFQIAINYQHGIGIKDAEANNTYFSDEAKMQWEISHVRFYKTIISELYKLCLNSRLSEIGFKVPRVDLETLETNLAGDLDKILAVYKEEFAKDIRRNRGEEV